MVVLMPSAQVVVMSDMWKGKPGVRKTRSSSFLRTRSHPSGTVKSVDDILGASFYYTRTKREKAGQTWPA